MNILIRAENSGNIDYTPFGWRGGGEQICHRNLLSPKCTLRAITATDNKLQIVIWRAATSATRIV